jgi:hypothetical protein
VSGRISGPATNGTGIGNQILFDLNGGSVGEDAMGTANISLTEPGNSYNQTGCTVSTLGANLQVASGYVFASFNCPDMQRLSSPSGATCMANGVFVLERCSE